MFEDDFDYDLEKDVLNQSSFTEANPNVNLDQIKCIVCYEIKE